MYISHIPKDPENAMHMVDGGEISKENFFLIIH